MFDLAQCEAENLDVNYFTMYEPTGRQFPHLAFLWPALAATSASEFAASAAKQFSGLAFGAQASPATAEPKWTTPNAVALELKTVRLRDFTTGRDGIPTLVCAPFALHGAAVVDLAPGHSLVAALRDAGLRRLLVTDWRSADADMRFLAIDDYLADLNVLVDQLGGMVDLVGLCQGGWMSLLYAARFPTKVHKLVLAGAPIDIAAGQSGLSALVDASPLELFQELVKLGDGRVLGHKVLNLWGPEILDSEDIHQLLQTQEPIGSPAFAKLEAIFRDWYAWTVDLPGTYYLEVIERLYKRNELATGNFVALGQTIDLANVRAPVFLLAARDDELVAPAQLFATERLINTPPHKIRKDMVPCRHVGLFMGRAVLNESWPRIVRWIVGSDASENAKPQRGSVSQRR
jgi:poly(3-hydroxybutyrate) depolymerase